VPTTLIPQPNQSPAEIGTSTVETFEHPKPLGWLGTIGAALGAVVSVIYLCNPGMGIFEILPDALPVIGNLDEVFFTLLLLYCLQNLGIRLPPAFTAMLARGRRQDSPDRATPST
jgi:hypothetical protein